MTVEKTVQKLSACAHVDGWLREKVTRIFDLFIFSLLPASSFAFAIAFVGRVHPSVQHLEIRRARTDMDTTLVFTILAVLTLMGLALNYMVEIVEYLTTPWRGSGES